MTAEGVPWCLVFVITLNRGISVALLHDHLADKDDGMTTNSS